MQVTVERTSALERRIQIEVPEERIASQVNDRLRSIGRSARIHGFRPGKAPPRVVERSYGRQVREEVVSELVRSSYLEAVAQHELHPAGGPNIDRLDAAPGQGLSFTAILEVYPEVAVPEMSSISVQRPVAEVTEGDVDAMIETLRRQRREWVPVQRAASTGDRIVIDYSGMVDGKEFAGGTGKEVPVEIGSGVLIPGFEESLVGLGADQVRAIELTFPENYRVSDLAGKPAVFEVRAIRVEEPRLPAVDADFARAFGIADGSIERLRAEVRANMEREVSETLWARLKEKVMDSLLGATAIEVPRTLTVAEAERLERQAMDQMMRQGTAGRGLELPKELFEEQARRRVALGLLLGEIAKTASIQVSPERVRARVSAVASTYEDPEEVVRWYYGDRQRLGEIESVVMEDQVVEWVLERAQVSDLPTSFDAVMKPGQTSRQA